MLCYKAWLDTRGRFGIGVLVLTCIAGLITETMVRRLSLEHAWPAQQIGWAIHDTWFEGMPPFWCLFAILLGSGGLLQQAGRGGGLFLLSLPANRTRLVLTRVVVVLVELYLLAL